MYVAPIGLRDRERVLAVAGLEHGVAMFLQDVADPRRPGADTEEHEAAREGVATTYAINDVRNLIMLADDEFFAVVQARGPAVMRGAARFPQRDCDRFQIREFPQYVFRQLLISRRIQLAGMHVHIRLNATNVGCSRFIAPVDNCPSVCNDENTSQKIGASSGRKRARRLSSRPPAAPTYAAISSWPWSRS